MISVRFRVWKQADGRWCIAADYGSGIRGRPFFVGGSPAHVMDCPQMQARRQKLRRRGAAAPTLADEVKRLIREKGTPRSDR